QVIHDLPNGVYRFRQVMPMSLSDAQLGPENPELSAARDILFRGKANQDSAERVGQGVLLSGKAESAPVEILVDLDGRISRGKCVCRHYQQYGIRNGPCRHMIALRSLATVRSHGAVAGANGNASLN